WFYSRSRKSLWQKGESSGNIQRVKRIWTDCDQDALRIEVEQVGSGACHKGTFTCFEYPVGHGEVAASSELDRSSERVVDQLYQVIMGRKEHPVEGSYTTYLFNEGVDKILKKVGEESTEVLIAAKDRDIPSFVAESADLIYHLLVLMAELDVGPDAVWKELAKRRGGGGSTDAPPGKIGRASCRERG